MASYYDGDNFWGGFDSGEEIFGGFGTPSAPELYQVCQVGAGR